jgi:hypothetical protein
MEITIRVTWKHTVAAVLLVLLLINTGRLYQHEGEKHMLLFVGTRHVWRYGLQSVKDVRWQLVHDYPYCRSEGGSVSECLAQASKRSAYMLLTDRPITLARQFVGVEKPFVIPPEPTSAGCVAALSEHPAGFENLRLSQAPIGLLLDICGR